MFSHLESKWKFGTKMIHMSSNSPSPRAGVSCRRQKARHPPVEYLMTMEEKKYLLLMIEYMEPSSPIFNESKKHRKTL